MNKYVFTESANVYISILLGVNVCIYILLVMSFVGHLDYGVAMIGRLLRIMSLFCRISSVLWGSFAKETYNFKEPTTRSHPIPRRL